MASGTFVARLRWATMCQTAAFYLGDGGVAQKSPSWRCAAAGKAEAGSKGDRQEMGQHMVETWCL